MIAPRIDNRLLRARRYLQQTATQNIKLSEIAKQANLSPFYFHRSYKQTYGETPHNHRSRLRLARAKTILRGGQYSIAEVCFEVGFESVSSFTAWFLRQVGLTPSRYQEYAKKRYAPLEIQSIFIPCCFLGMALAQD